MRLTLCRPLCSLLAIFSAVVAEAKSVPEYNEVLELTPLPSNFLFSSFSFNTSIKGQALENGHFDIFPRSLIQIAKQTKARSLHLRFSRGRWNQEIWGAVPRQGRQAGGSGIEVWATIGSGSDEASSRVLWKQLVNSLSGLFCASMNFIDSTRTIEPAFALRNPEAQGTLFSYGVLPSETICTENLTPFLKLLPCKGRAGISSLLSGHKLFDTDWSSMAVDVEFGSDSTTVFQSVDMVFDLERALHAASDPIPGSQPAEELVCAEGKAYTTELTCFPKDGRPNRDWSLEKVFGTPVIGRCSISDPEGIDILVNHGSNARLVPHSSARSDFQSSYTLSDDNLNLQFSDVADFSVIPAPLLVRRSLTSYGSSLHGKITLHVTNNQPQVSEITYLSVLPWFLRPYLHSLHTSHQGILKDTIYKPAKDRIRPTHLELKLQLPANSSASVSFDFERTVLRYAEYPPDANRGFDVPAAVIILGMGEYSVRTTSLLLSLPTPDFSMPYNVIILTCTVVALCFGSMFNLLSRRLALASEVPVRMSRLGRLKQIFSRK